MAIMQRVSRTELSRNTRHVLSNVQRGRMAMIESHGKPEAVLLDVVDYRILRAVMRYYAELPDVNPAGLSEAVARATDDPEALYAQVFAYYLAGSISLARAAELLGMSWLELRTRCLRLNVPLRVAPGDADGAAVDVATASEW